MNYKIIDGSITAPLGFKASGVHCGIRRNRSKKDLALIAADTMCDAAAVYTQNKVKGAPLIVTKKHLENGHAQAIICNSGNANTCNADGIYIAEEMCKVTAAALNLIPDDVLVGSTGVIGEPLPLNPVKASIPNLAHDISISGNDSAIEAIMTTDTRKKSTAIEFDLCGKKCRIGGIAKGSGMINPNMATMLCFLTTDAAINANMLHRALLDCTGTTFNMVCVDGDTSTNDMAVILASGHAENQRITEPGDSLCTFTQALRIVMTKLAREVARDGEGATKLLECMVTNAPDKNTAKVVAKSVISSNLLKAAIFGSDANWGRVLCAVGYAPVDLDPSKVDVSFASTGGKIDVYKAGSGVNFSEDEARNVLIRDEVCVIVCLNSGSACATAWGCDLTYDYVKINGDYRS